MSERTPKTPNTSVVREGWRRGHPFPLVTEPEERWAEFDRWLAQHDAEVAAEAVREVVRAQKPREQVMIEYTPTTYEARKWYSWKPLTTVDGTFDKKYEAEFDRWLAEHDEEVAERERNRIIWWLENELDIAQHFGRSWSLGRRQYKKFAYGFKIAIGILKGEIDE